MHIPMKWPMEIELVGNTCKSDLEFIIDLVNYY